jgi:hypothetical protein
MSRQAAELHYRVTIRLDDLEHADLYRICEGHGLNASQVLRRGLELAIQELDDGRIPGFPPERAQRSAQSGPAAFSPAERIAR